MMDKQYGFFCGRQSGFLAALMIAGLAVVAPAQATADATATTAAQQPPSTVVESPLTTPAEQPSEWGDSAKAIIDEQAVMSIEPTVSEQSLEADAQLVAMEEGELLMSDEPLVESTLPHNLSPWGMFMAADWVVRLVMISLALASLLTWTVLVSKLVELAALRRGLRKSRALVISARALADVTHSSAITKLGRELVGAAQVELQLSADTLSQQQNAADIKDGIKERLASNLTRIEAGAARRMMMGTGVLASVGATAPFVGLFGTVWGIMNSFIGISKAQTTNLAVVAPGIAEALLATALGLVAAIPAVMIYNYFSRQISGMRTVIADITAGIMRLVSRDLDRGTSLSSVKPNVAPVKTAVKAAE